MKEFHAPQYFSLAEVRTHTNSNFRLHAWHYPGTPFSGWVGHYPESITPFRKSPPSFRYPFLSISAMQRVTAREHVVESLHPTIRTGPRSGIERDFFETSSR